MYATPAVFEFISDDKQLPVVVTFDCISDNLQGTTFDDLRTFRFKITASIGSERNSDNAVVAEYASGEINLDKIITLRDELSRLIKHAIPSHPINTDKVANGVLRMQRELDRFAGLLSSDNDKDE